MKGETKPIIPLERPIVWSKGNFPEGQISTGYGLLGYAPVRERSIEVIIDEVRENWELA